MGKHAQYACYSCSNYCACIRGSWIEWLQWVMGSCRWLSIVVFKELWIVIEGYIVRRRWL